MCFSDPRMYLFFLVPGMRGPSECVRVCVCRYSLGPSLSATIVLLLLFFPAMVSNQQHDVYPPIFYHSRSTWNKLYVNTNSTNRKYFGRLIACVEWCDEHMTNDDECRLSSVYMTMDYLFRQYMTLWIHFFSLSFSSYPRRVATSHYISK